MSQAPSGGQSLGAWLDEFVAQHTELGINERLTLQTIADQLSNSELAGSEADLLAAETAKRGLPCSLATLLRHIENNHLATLGAVRSTAEWWEERAKQAGWVPER